MNGLTVEAAIYSLRAMRRLKSDPFADTDLAEIVEAATMACSTGNTQPWWFLVITDAEKKQEIGDIYQAIGKQVIEQGVLASGVLDQETEQVYRNALVLVENLRAAPALILCCLQGFLFLVFKER